MVLLDSWRIEYVGTRAVVYKKLDIKQVFCLKFS